MEKEYYKYYSAPDGSVPSGDAAPTHIASASSGGFLRNFASDDIILLVLILFLLGSDSEDRLPVLLLAALFIIGFQKEKEDDI